MVEQLSRMFVSYKLTKEDSPFTGRFRVGDVFDEAKAEWTIILRNVDPTMVIDGDTVITMRGHMDLVKAWAAEGANKSIRLSEYATKVTKQ